MNFSSAFSTIILALLQDSLSPLSAGFLSDRRQHMKLGKHGFDSLTFSTGFHCVVFFYCTSSHQSIKLLSRNHYHPCTLVGSQHQLPYKKTSAEDVLLVEVEEFAVIDCPHINHPHLLSHHMVHRCHIQGQGQTATYHLLC